jgi:plasmid stabilization system protein ParE
LARYTVLFDRDAHTDLAGIRDYIAGSRGAEFAEAFVRRIILHCESFATVPHRGTKRDAIRPGLRTTTCAEPSQSPSWCRIRQAKSSYSAPSIEAATF